MSLTTGLYTWHMRAHTNTHMQVHAYTSESLRQCWYMSTLKGCSLGEKSTKVRDTGTKENNEAEMSKDGAPLKVTLALTHEFTP